MSYDKSGAHLQFFVPYIPLATTTSVPLREIDIGAASGTHGEFLCVKPCDVNQILFTLLGELGGGTSVAPTVVFTKRVTTGSDTGATAVGTLTIPDATAVNKTVYKSVTPVNFQVGDLMKISWTVGTGTPTGMGVASWICTVDPEVAGNNSDMIASA